MKICHVTSVHSEKDDRIFYRECISLVHAGYSVCEIAPNVKDTMSDGVQIYGVSIPENKWKRVLFGKKKVYNKCVELDADIYHFHDPELISVGLKLKKKNHKVVIFDSHEDVPAQVLTKDWLPPLLRRPLSKIYTGYEKRSLQQYDALVSVTPSITSRLQNVNPNTIQLTNYPLLINPQKEDSRKWGHSICFAGTVSHQRMHHVILDALKDISGIEYRLAGACPASYLHILQSKEAWHKVCYVGQIPFKDVFNFLLESSVGIVLNDYYPNVGYKLGTLGVVKLFEFMQAGLPVICTDFILWKEIMDKWDCGICVNPHDVDAIRGAIEYLISHKDIAKRMGDNGRRAVQEEYNWPTQEPMLFQMYEELTEKCK